MECVNFIYLVRLVSLISFVSNGGGGSFLNNSAHFIIHADLSKVVLLPLNGSCIIHPLSVSPKAEGTPQMVSHNALLCPAGKLTSVYI